MRAERKGAVGVWGAGGWGKGATLRKGFASKGSTHHQRASGMWQLCSLLCRIPPVPPSQSRDTDVKHSLGCRGRARLGQMLFSILGIFLPAQGVGLL